MRPCSWQANSRQLTVDPNTANEYVFLSESNGMMTVNGETHPYPDHPDRFDHWWQALCRQSVCGRCYWEIEWSACNCVDVSVSYKSTGSKGRGKECVFGYNDQSWSLFCSADKYMFKYNKTETCLPVNPTSRRIEVFVDHSAGTLSFYSISDTISIIHTVQTTFTQPLYPGFGLSTGSSVKLC
ncbi:hypothetical protein M9458_052257 [Cirrhinus mrigala]|uniref:B30.2/SPRY domain-containing protein n=1 Tax=Cirrhinus mrigala TaxID=683832 RepID=A0ABD0MR62_CIRMR